MCLGNEIFSLPTILKIEKYFHSIKMANRKGVYMILDEGDIITKENYANYMGEIIKEGLANPVVRKMCTQSRGMSPEDIKKVEKEFCRFVGYCILFRSSKNVGEYMFLHNREEQMRFLKEKIAEKLGIPKDEIDLIFKKCWVEYKDTIPCLMFVPVKDVGINDDIEIEQYLDDEGMELLFDDIILGKVNPGKNYCCKKSIQPEKLSCVDLSPILPRFIIGRENTNGSTDVLNQSNIQHGEDER